MKRRHESLYARVLPRNGSRHIFSPTIGSTAQSFKHLITKGRKYETTKEGIFRSLAAFSCFRDFVLS